MLDLNQRPPPCKELAVSQTFVDVQISLQIYELTLLTIRLRPLLFTWVGVLIV